MVRPEMERALRGPAIIEAHVTSLHPDATDIRVDIQMDQRSVAKHGVRGAVVTAMRPWLGDKLLRKGCLIYLHDAAGRVEVATKVTSLVDILSAEAIEIVIQSETILPTSMPGKQRRLGSRDEEREPMFGGYDSLGDGTFYVK